MKKDTRGSGWALVTIGALVFVGGVAVLLFSDWSGVTDRRGIPNWLFGLAAVGVGALAAFQGVKVVRKPSD